MVWVNLQKKVSQLLLILGAMILAFTIGKIFAGMAPWMPNETGYDLYQLTAGIETMAILALFSVLIRQNISLWPHLLLQDTQILGLGILAYLTSLIFKSDILSALLLVLATGCFAVSVFVFLVKHEALDQKSSEE